MVRRYRMIPKGAKAAVALSGGKDSGGLLHILGALRGRLNYTLTAVHVDMELVLT
jgi:tRNA(Ile)-lysidine synthase TilS/MesJ